MPCATNGSLTRHRAEEVDRKEVSSRVGVSSASFLVELPEVGAHEEAVAPGLLDHVVLEAVVEAARVLWIVVVLATAADGVVDLDRMFLRVVHLPGEDDLGPVFTSAVSVVVVVHHVVVLETIRVNGMPTVPRNIFLTRG